MGLLFGSAEAVAYLIMAFAQWRIGRAILAWTAKPGWLPVNTVRRGLIAGAAVLVFGILISYHTIAAWNPMNYKLSGGLRAAVFIWCCGSTAGWIIYRILPLAKVLPDKLQAASHNPARRRWALRRGQ